MEDAIETWRAGGGEDWRKTVGLKGKPLWAWPSYPKLLVDPYLEGTELADGGDPMFPGFNALCAMQMLHDLLQQCTAQWEEQAAPARTLLAWGKGGEQPPSPRQALSLVPLAGGEPGGE